MYESLLRIIYTVAKLVITSYCAHSHLDYKTESNFGAMFFAKQT